MIKNFILELSAREMCCKIYGRRSFYSTKIPFEPFYNNPRTTLRKYVSLFYRFPVLNLHQIFFETFFHEIRK